MTNPTGNKITGVIRMTSANAARDFIANHPEPIKIIEVINYTVRVEVPLPMNLAAPLIRAIPEALRALLYTEDDVCSMFLCAAGKKYEEACQNASSRNAPLGAYPAEIISAQSYRRSVD